jgi:hypothetical protein
MLRPVAVFPDRARTNGALVMCEVLLPDGTPHPSNLEEHIEVYGPDNHLRLTGLHETQAIDTFSWGVADRGASIRVPHGFVSNGYRGYLEDRRPNSQGDPYRIAGRILETIAMAEQPSSNGSRELTLTATAA